MQTPEKFVDGNTPLHPIVPRLTLLAAACWCATSPALAQDGYAVANKPSQTITQTTNSYTAALPPATPTASAPTIQPPPPAISMEQLISRLKKTAAIGFFTKLALRSDALDLQQDIHQAVAQGAMPDQQQTLRQRFDGLVMKILALLDKDPPLASDIFHARESIWLSLIQTKETENGAATA
ncbi:MAG: hypothetical protein R8J84_03695 [Mariprofundales bacterium]